MTEDNRNDQNRQKDQALPKDEKIPEEETNLSGNEETDSSSVRIGQRQTENPYETESGLTVSGLRDSNTVNSLPTTEMEVHHHPRLDHKPKPWKEYLLEGLMIFIAVMMGFIAENIREGIADREHVHELVSQLVRDLRDDTLRLNEIFQAETQILKANDTLVAILQVPLEKVDIVRMQQLIIRSHNIWPFHPSTGAIGAIKNELHLKQFSSSKMIGLIANYEGHIDLLFTVQEITLQYQRNYLDPFLVKHFTAASLDAAFTASPEVSAEARILSKEDLLQLGAEMVLIRINTQELLRDNRRLKNDAVNLLLYTNMQYGP